MKQSDIARVKQEAADKAIETAMILLLALPIKVMHEQFGWGMKSRLPKLADALTEEYQRFADGEMTLEEYSQYVYDMVGIKFQKTED
jgi:uncharacterized membrane protein